MDGKFRNNSLNDLVKYSLIKTQFGAIRPPKDVIGSFSLVHDKYLADLSQ